MSSAVSPFVPTDVASRLFRGNGVLLLALLIALLARVAAGLLLPDQHFPDAAGYRESAQQFWQSGHTNNLNAMPLYPALVGLVGVGTGQLILDIALSTITVWLVHLLALSIWNDRVVAGLAALGMALYPHAIFYAVVGLTETLFVTLLLAAYASWYRRKFFMAAVFAVLAILTRPVFDLLAPALVVLFALATHRLSVASATRQLVFYAAVYCTLMTPWWAHNYRVYGSFVRLIPNFGYALQSGNNPLNQTGGGLRGIDFDTTAYDDIKDPVVRDRAMRDAAVDFIIHNPGKSLKLAALKFLRFWRLWPHHPTYANTTGILASVLGFIPILLLSIVYLLMHGVRDIRRISPMLAFIAYLTVVHTIIVGSLRYRYPLEPFMIVFAAGALAALARRWGFLRNSPQSA